MWIISLENRRLYFGSSSQSGVENEQISGFLIFVNANIPLDAAAHKKASKRPVIEPEAVLTATPQVPLPERFPEKETQ